MLSSQESERQEADSGVERIRSCYIRKEAPPPHRSSLRALSDRRRDRDKLYLLCALCLIDGEIGISSIVTAVNRLCDTRGISEVNVESVQDLVNFMKADSQAQKIMKQIVNKLTSISDDGDTEQKKLVRKFEMRMAFNERKSNADIPFSIHWF